MYKNFSAKDLLVFHNLGEDYKVSGFLVYGTYKKSVYEDVERIVQEIDPNASIRYLPNEFLDQILEVTLLGKKYWFVTAYGGALLSEYTHMASLFGSQSNIIVGSCGGLLPSANTNDIIVPTYSYGDESTTRVYDPTETHQHHADDALRKKLIAQLESTHKIWEGPTVTHQAMLAETWEDVEQWSAENYLGVEMEAATVFAISKHFNVPSAAVLRITDNLIKKETVLDAGRENQKEVRRQVSNDILRAALNVLSAE